MNPARRSLLTAPLTLAPKPAFSPQIGVLISANAEWRPLRKILNPAKVESSPFGEFFTDDAEGARLLFFHGGWGKMAAAASTQYVIDRWKPQALLNLGTCGGIAGAVDRGATILATKTIVYDIVERMGNPDEAIAERSTSTPPAFTRAPFPSPVTLSPLVSADADLAPADTTRLRQRYNAVAADWESGAIAWVAQANSIPVLILRTVSDLVGTNGGEAYGDLQLFEQRTETIMRQLLSGLPAWCQFLLDRSRQPR